MEDFAKVECEECEGTGVIHVLTMQICSVVRGECCGGCGYDEECEECEGTGDVYLQSCCGDDLDPDNMICPTCKEHC